MITYCVFHRIDCDIQDPRIMNRLHAAVLELEKELKMLVNLEFYAVTQNDCGMVTLYLDKVTGQFKRSTFEQSAVFLVRKTDLASIGSGVSLMEWLNAKTL